MRLLHYKENSYYRIQQHTRVTLSHLSSWNLPGITKETNNHIVIRVLASHTVSFQTWSQGSVWTAKHQRQRSIKRNLTGPAAWRSASLMQSDNLTKQHCKKRHWWKHGSSQEEFLFACYKKIGKGINGLLSGTEQTQVHERHTLKRVSVQQEAGWS